MARPSISPIDRRTKRLAALGAGVVIAVTLVGVRAGDDAASPATTAGQPSTGDAGRAATGDAGHVGTSDAGRSAAGDPVSPGSGEVSSRADPAAQDPGAPTTAESGAVAGGRTTAVGATSTGQRGSNEIGEVPGSGGGVTRGAPAMTVTLQLDPDAVWNDGTPITVADLRCTLAAAMRTPGSLTQEGYELITSIDEGEARNSVVLSFSQPYAGYKSLFDRVLKADFFDDCNDVSADLGTELPFSGQPFQLESWSPDQAVLVPNESYWDATAAPRAERIVIVPRDSTALLSGEVDFIFPQSAPGLIDSLDRDPAIAYAPAPGTSYEGLYFQQRQGPFADAAFRQAFARSIDRNLVLTSIYGPILPGGSLLNCGPWLPTIGPWCDDGAFGAPDGTDGFYDPASAQRILTDAGWERDANGFWATDGEAPTIRWMIDTPNPRRESTRALLVPALRAAGFRVVADDCNAACVFQQRLPSADFDLVMHTSAAQLDPTVTSLMSCDAIPTEENGYVGRNSSGWCNPEASAVMAESDRTLDVEARAAQIHRVARLLADDAVMLPLYQFPNVAAWNTTRLGGPVDAAAGSHRAWQNINEWEDVDGDGQIVIGAEQWPECLNPITECANSYWYVWTTAFKVLPSLWDTTSAGTYVPSNLLVDEPEVRITG